MLIKKVYPSLTKSDIFSQSLALLRADAPCGRFTGITDGLVAPLVAAYRQELKRSILFLTPDQETAERTYDDLSTLLAEDVSFFPAPEILPYEKDFTHAASARERIRTLAALGAGKFNGIIVAPIEAVFFRTLPLSQLEELTITLEVGQDVDTDELLEKLVVSGYEPAELVEMAGEFCRRGGIVDVFAFPYHSPVRFEFFGDTLESIREFNPLNQRSKEHLEKVSLLPRREALAFYEEAEEYCPLSFFNYLPGDTLIIYRDKPTIQENLRRFREKIDSAYQEKLAQDGLSPIPAGRLCLGEEDFGENDELWGSIDFNPHDGDLNFQSEPASTSSLRIDHLAKTIKNYLDKNYRIIIWCGEKKETDRLSELIEGYLGKQAHSIHFALGSFNHGFHWREGKLLVLTDQEIFHRFTIPHRYRRVSAGAPLTSFLELKKHDYVVHYEHGIGRYQGIEHLVIDNKGMDFITIEYQGEDKLYLPASQIKEVEKYLGSDQRPPTLNRLGTTTFAQLKQRVKESLMSMAKELLELYAMRETHPGIAYEADSIWQREFETAFPYEETPDQFQAIKEVKNDMEKSKPMDRLICGDVGYGKTEVAMRAAFKAVMNSRQVAILVPTTILAQQHFNTISKRMSEYPVKVGLLSRFLTKAEQKEMTVKIKEGQIDIIIGTHRLLSSDVQFKNLGLLIIDEEQRFGVRHKEKIKRLKTNVDVLVLTATPIPRTLYLALSGTRDMSVINTPPADRLPIKTFVLPYEPPVVHSAILQEIKRGGQVFFVHNRVEDIEKTARKISNLVPEAEIGIAHGQLPEKELEEMMRAFLAKEFNVLVTTTIIENGLDMPNVNTIIITKSDRFGLSQLYQLRGRVGRADTQAYAYLFYSSHEALSADAKKRLAAINEFNDLGAGFKIAMKDLEIRGTGNLLGKEQHGKIAQVGFDLYCKLLAQAVNELSGESASPLSEPEIKLTLNAYLPDDYIPHSEIKVDIYKKIAALSDKEEKEKLAAELQDRFGPLPEPVTELFRAVDLRLLCTRVGVEKINMQKRKILIQFSPQAHLNIGPKKFLKKFQPRVKFLGANPPQVEVNTADFSDAEIITYLQQVLSCFSFSNA